MNTTQSKKNSDVYSVILSGGSGTRLWPLSRKRMPKQFLKLGGSRVSLLQLSIERTKKISPANKRWIVTAQGQEHLCAEYQNELSRILVEPEARNTAPAIAYAAWELMKVNPDAIMVVLSSDHFIQNVGSFEQTIAEAVELAENNMFVTIGIPPTFPSTGFGYIELGLPLTSQGEISPTNQTNDNDFSCYSVRSFREKPNLAAAEQFIRTGKYLWNAGIFIWKVKTFWNAYSHLNPESKKIFDKMSHDNIAELYATLPAQPIDIAFMEQTSHRACVPARFDWNDIGSWAAVKECFVQDDQGNSINGPVYTYETRNCLVQSTGQFVATVGLENIAVIATEDAILVMPLARSQDVKKVIHYLEQNHKNLL